MKSALPSISSEQFSLGLAMLTAVLVGCVGPALLSAQTAGAVPKFEVASIRRCQQGQAAGGAGRSADPNIAAGRLDIPCQTVKGLIQNAYNLIATEQQPLVPLTMPIEGGEAWINSDRYRIQAKPEGSPTIRMMNGPMMQGLLEDRFKLKLHRETREVAVYELAVAKNGAKLPAFDPSKCVVLDPTVSMQPGKPFCGRLQGTHHGDNLLIEVYGVSVEDFATYLGVNAGPQLLDRSVVDKTGIRGLFDFRLEFLPDDSTPGAFNLRRRPSDTTATSATPNGPSIFTALQEQLGLKLERAKGSSEVLVIDHVERPSEN